MYRSYAIITLRKGVENKSEDCGRMYGSKFMARITLGLLDKEELINSGIVLVCEHVNNKIVASIKKDDTWFYIIEVEPMYSYNR